jgi:hypothetical protein
MPERKISNNELRACLSFPETARELRETVHVVRSLVRSGRLTGHRDQRPAAGDAPQSAGVSSAIRMTLRAASDALMERLVKEGGPRAFLERVAKQAAREERMRMLAELDRIAQEVADDPSLSWIAHLTLDHYRRQLRRMLGVRQSAEEKRAKARKRVRANRKT